MSKIRVCEVCYAANASRSANANNTREMLDTPDVPWLGETCALCGGSSDAMGSDAQNRARLFDLAAARNDIRLARGALKKTAMMANLLVKVVANAILAIFGAGWRLLRGVPTAFVKRNVSTPPEQE